jgi:ATP/maltotriose-dependent transcriptional regulator MalT
MDKFCGPLCQAVTGLKNSAALLKELAKGNSLIFHLDATNEWFRFHHLFSDFLSRRLRRKAIIQETVGNIPCSHSLTNRKFAWSRPWMNMPGLD